MRSLRIQGMEPAKIRQAGEPPVRAQERGVVLDGESRDVRVWNVVPLGVDPPCETVAGVAPGDGLTSHRSCT